MERLMRISRLRHVGLARSAEGNAVLVRRHPLVERLQLRISASARTRRCGCELEHVPDVVGAGKAEAPEDVGRHVVVAHLLAERPRKRDLRTGRVLARDFNGLADQLAATLEDPVAHLPMSSTAMLGSFLSPIG